MASWTYSSPITAKTCCTAITEMAPSPTSPANPGCSNLRTTGTPGRLSSITTATVISISSSATTLPTNPASRCTIRIRPWSGCNRPCYTGPQDCKDQRTFSITIMATELSQMCPKQLVSQTPMPRMVLRLALPTMTTMVGPIAGVAVDENGGSQGGMGVDTGDYDGDGLLDIIKTNYSDQTTSLYHNQGNGFFSDRTFQAGLSGQTSSVKWGTAFFDFDNDGQLDVFIVTGAIYPPGLGGRHGKPKEEEGKKILYRNLGNGRFQDISARGGPGLVSPRCSRGAAFGDIFRTGQIDVVINNLNDFPTLLRNQSPSPNSWLLVRLVGTRANRAAIGSRVIVEAEGRRQIQEVRSGGSFCSQSDFRLHFGLGRAREATRVTIKWLGDRQEILEPVPANRLVVIQEGKGIVGQEKF